MSEPVDIFVSYAREDEDRAGRLVRALEACGWRVFWDRTIPPGETWRSHIGVPLDQATVVLVAWSHHSIDADFVHSEANRAKMRGALVPILFDEVAPPLGFEHIHAADLTRWVVGQGTDLPDLLVRTLERRLAQPARVAPSPPPTVRVPTPAYIEARRPADTPRRRFPIPVIAGVVAALIVAAGLGALAGGRSDPANTSAELASLREQKGRLQDQLRYEAKARQDAVELAKTANAKIAAREKELLDLRAAKGDAEERVNAANAKVAAMEQERRDIEAAASKAAAMHKSEYEAEWQARREAQEATRRAGENIQSLETRILALEKQLREAQAAPVKAASLEKQLRDAARELEGAKLQLQTAESDARRASSRADAAEVTLAALRREIEALKSAKPAPSPTRSALVCRTARGDCGLDEKWKGVAIGGYCSCAREAVSGGVTSLVSGTVQSGPAANAPATSPPPQAQIPSTSVFCQGWIGQTGVQCFMPSPLPIGSSCSCRGTPGTILRPDSR